VSSRFNSSIISTLLLTYLNFRERKDLLTGKVIIVKIQSYYASHESLRVLGVESRNTSLINLMRGYMVVSETTAQKIERKKMAHILWIVIIVIIVVALI
tara:strand:- start:2249 stop:2545 length:297 start_codon:yes stop_codon:yes gene_type:complete